MASAFRRKSSTGTRYATRARMPHPYPPHWAHCSYVGRIDYSLTYVTDNRRELFTNASTVDFVRSHFLRAAAEERFEEIAYCFMPDHLHVIVSGRTDESDCKAFIKAAKQYSSYYWKQRHGYRLWERYGHDRVIRTDWELAMTIGYLVANPVRERLVAHPRDYPFLGSSKYTVDELLEWCEYSEAMLLG